MIAKVYLAGAVANNQELAIKQFTYEYDRLSVTYDVVNPMEGIIDTDVDSKEYERLLREGLKKLLCCDYIYYVNDTTKSKGAFIESLVAQACGIKRLWY